MLSFPALYELPDGLHDLVVERATILLCQCNHAFMEFVRWKPQLYSLLILWRSEYLPTSIIHDTILASK
jgi:hypothetical protein